VANISFDKLYFENNRNALGTMPSLSFKNHQITAKKLRCNLGYKNYSVRNQHEKLLEKNSLGKIARNGVEPNTQNLSGFTHQQGRAHL